MTTPQLYISALLPIVLATTACNRADTDATAGRAATEMRGAASRAGDQLADSWLTTKIQAQYFADADIKARYVNVSTRDGVVTLTGRVDNEALREQALNIARYTDGVKRVEDRLLVDGAARAAAPAVAPESSVQPVATSGTTPVDGLGLDRVDDASVTSRIQAKYYLDNTMKERRIEVETRDGVVTVRGEVASDNERAQALLLARTTEGVQRVEDALAVNASLGQAGIGAVAPAQPPTPPRSDDEALTALVQSRWSADADLAAAAIQVTAKDGVVLLDGTLSTVAAKQRAVSLARGTEGVIQVIDRLQVRRTR